MTFWSSRQFKLFLLRTSRNVPQCPNKSSTLVMSFGVIQTISIKKSAQRNLMSCSFLNSCPVLQRAPAVKGLHPLSCKSFLNTNLS